jgi:hypothetical protein
VVIAGRWSRIWFGATAVCVIAGVTISVFTAANNVGGSFHSPLERALNTFAFFTVESNLIVGATSVLLALGPPRSSVGFKTLRLTGVVCITVTGLVYHVALAGLLDLQGWDRLGDQLVHTVVPILAVVGWLLFGPRKMTSKPIVFLSLLFPIAWLTFTLIRGAFVHWYPYPFIDVVKLGYGGTAVNCLWVALLLLGLAAGFNVSDRRMAGQTTDVA